jgi:poly(A) polymerase
VSIPLERLPALGEAPMWLVGGAIRDELLSRATTDFDLAYGGDVPRLARRFAREADAHPFALSDAFGAWRVVAHDHSWQLDIVPLAGETIEADLAQRDLTVNAIARVPGEERYVDPFGGIDDARARLLRMVSTQAFERDPVRTLRLVRLACELECTIDPATCEVAAAASPAVARAAPERVFTELRLTIACRGAVQGLGLLDRLGVTDVVLPEMARLRGVEQSQFHHLDVHEHTRAVLAETIALEEDPEPVFGEHAVLLARFLEQPLANELTRGQALRFGALFHDVAKPITREVAASGRVTFMGHDRAGAEVAATALRRLRASERLCDYVAALTLHHLRLGFLIHEMPLSRRTIYRYLKTCEPVQVDVTLLSVADRLATRGKGSEVAIDKHLRLARQLMGEALRWREDPPRPPVRGDELAKAAGVRPGPELGRVLAELEEAAFAGEISGHEQALARGRELLNG